jgi:hypothetical protein
MAAIDLKDCTIKIKDGTGTPKEITIKVGEGTLTYDETQNVEYKLNKGDEVPMDVKLDFEMDYVATAALATPDFTAVEQFIKGTGFSVISTDTDTCAPYACDIEVSYAPTCTGGSAYTKKITFPDFRWEKFSHDLGAATVSCTGKCNVEEAIHA